MNSHNRHVAHLSESITYFCPMHPEVRQGKPDDCPKCGMHLVPESELDNHAEHEHHSHCHNGHAAQANGDYDTVPVGHDGAVYTCPMHAQVRKIHPGSCPRLRHGAGVGGDG